MTTTPRLLLAALTLSIVTLHVFSMEIVPRLRCHCRMTTMRPVPRHHIKKVEIRSPGALCRKTEIIITKRNGFIVCIDPRAEWIQVILNEIVRSRTSSSTTAIATARQRITI